MEGMSVGSQAKARKVVDKQEAAQLAVAREARAALGEAQRGVELLAEERRVVVGLAKAHLEGARWEEVCWAEVRWEGELRVEETLVSGQKVAMVMEE